MKNLPKFALSLIVAGVFAQANASTVPLSSGYSDAGAHPSAVYGATSEYLGGSKSLLVDSHALSLLGLENCCDAGEQVPVKAASNHPASVAGGDSLVSEVPEPTIYAMLLIGLGLLGFTARRKQDDKF